MIPKTSYNVRSEQGGNLSTVLGDTNTLEGLPMTQGVILMAFNLMGYNIPGFFLKMNLDIISHLIDFDR